MTEPSDNPSSSFHNDDEDPLFLHGNLPAMVRILPTDLHQWMASRPLTRLQSRKYSSCRTRKWEYRVCRCGCGYRMSLTQLADADGSEFYEVKESATIPSHHRDVDESPDNIPLTKDILSAIDNLLEQHKFAKNYGPKRLVTDLRRQGVAEDKIPSQKQLQNHLYYFRKTKFQYSNEISPLEEKLRNYIYVDDELEPLDKPFVYHYDTDDDGRLILGDGSDE